MRVAPSVCLVRFFHARGGKAAPTGTARAETIARVTRIDV